MPFRIRPVPGRRACTVVFTAPADVVAGLEVAVGPCVHRRGPRGGHLQPIASPLDQRPDRVDHLQALFGVLSPGETGEVWNERIDEPPGTLLTLRRVFAAALRAYSADWPAYGGTGGPTHSDAIERAWLAAVDWPPGQATGGLTMRLLGYAIEAQTAGERGQELYCWTGPEVPMASIASGRTVRDFDDYRRGTRRR